MKLFEILKKLGILRGGTGDYYTGEYSSNSKGDKGKEGSVSKTKGGKSVILLIFTFFIGGFFILAGFGTSIGSFLAMLIFWVIIFVVFLKFSFSFWLNIVILITFTFISLPLVGNSSQKSLQKKESVSANLSENLNNNSEIGYPSGEEIYIEAKTGLLSNGGEYSRVGESSRGGEAYLGDGGASVSYNININEAGEYTMFVYLNDDGAHPDGMRNATVSVNGDSLQYKHISEDTGLWKWYELGTVKLLKGDNKIEFRKDQTTSAAFIMNAFKLVPRK